MSGLFCKNVGLSSNWYKGRGDLSESSCKGHLVSTLGCCKVVHIRLHHSVGTTCGGGRDWDSLNIGRSRHPRCT
jgi:hypothetical protein